MHSLNDLSLSNSVHPCDPLYMLLKNIGQSPDSNRDTVNKRVLMCIIQWLLFFKVFGHEPEKRAIDSGQCHSLKSAKVHRKGIAMIKISEITLEKGSAQEQ